MKGLAIKLSILITSLVLLSFTTNDSRLKRYEIESGVLIYKYSGNASGIRVHYFDDYGMKESIKDSLVISFRSFKQQKNNLTLRNNFKLCKINLNNNQAVVKESSEFENFKQSSNSVEIYKLNEDLMIKQGAQILEETSIKGKPCKVFQHHDTKKYFWKGIPLKIETDVMGMKVVMELDEFHENLKPSEKMFEIPKNVNMGEFKENKVSL